jgi:hypothetical protein
MPPTAYVRATHPCDRAVLDEGRCPQCNRKRIESGCRVVGMERDPYGVLFWTSHCRTPWREVEELRQLNLLYNAMVDHVLAGNLPPLDFLLEQGR